MFPLSDRVRVSWIVAALGAVFVFLQPLAEVHADSFTGFRVVRKLFLPAGAGPFEALADGRVITLIGDAVHIETGVRTGVFTLQGTLPGSDIPPFGAAFIGVSPDGTKIAVGDNVDEVGVFDVATLAGTWFTAPHLDGAWLDDRYLLLSAFGPGSESEVIRLDTESASPTSPDILVVVEHINGAPAGVALDGSGNLYTGNGFGDDPLGTGTIKSFNLNAFGRNAQGIGPFNWQTDGRIIVDVLSASPIGFDHEGDLFTGGGDFFGGGETDSVALAKASAVARANAGMGVVDVNLPSELRRLDPDEANPGDFYELRSNPLTQELYVRNFGESTVYVYFDVTGIPAVSTWGLLCLSLLIVTAGSVYGRKLPAVHGAA